VSRKILIADDEPSIVTAVEFLMRREGYEVSVARDGSEALACIESSRPDLIVLDVMMPQKSGYEICKSIREREDWRGIKIVVLSAKGRDAEVAKGLAMGADVYITKPFSTRDLMTRVKALLDEGDSSTTS
jgi:DNA-binding response OmpR family regulator